tara:strand:+ start:271 stop:774 length:504 start_codon:yes stop_codon:yes gene_type:complete
MRISSGGSEFVNILQTDTVTMRGHDKVTNDGLAFSCYGYHAATSSNYSLVQLKNPSSSGKTILLDSLTWSSTATSKVAILAHDTDLTNDTFNGVNLKLGSATGVAQIRTEADTSIPGTYLFWLDGASGTNPTIEFAYPIELGEGKGVITATGAVNLLNNTVFKYREV